MACRTRTLVAPLTAGGLLTALATAIAAQPATGETGVPESCDQGRRAMQEKQDDAVIQLYAECLSHDNLGQEIRFEAHYHSGETLVYLGRFKQAADHFAEAVRLAPDFTAASFGLATSLGQIGEYERALKALDDYTRQYTVGNKGYYLSIRGWLLNHSGRYQEAIASLDKAIREGVVDVDVYLNRSNALAGLGRFEESYADLDSALALEPSNALVYSQYGSNLRIEGQFHQAISKLDKALELDPAETIALLERGRTKFELNDLDGAIADFSRAAEIDPGEAWAYADRAQILMLQGEHERAMVDLERALELSPGNVNALTLHGEQLKYQGRYEEAREDLEAALAIEPDNSYIRHEYAGALYGFGLWDESLAEYDKAARLDPTNSHHVGGRGYLRLRLGESRAALDDFNKAVTDLPDIFQWYLFRAHALAWLGRESDASADIDKAFALMTEGDKAWYYNDICWDLLLQGATGLAGPLCAEAVALGADHNSHDSLAFHDWQVGRERNALANLAKALKLSNGDAFFKPSRRLNDYPSVLAQGLLMYLGYRPDEPDTTQTEKTHRAIEAFQRDQRLPVDGQVSDRLIAALKAAKP